MAFQGSLAELHLPDIIQLVSVSGKTGVFHLVDGVHRGQIWLFEGRIVHAEAEDLAGEEAVYSLAIWRTRRVPLRAERGGAAPDDQKSNTGLLMEAARRLDEWRVLSKKIPSVELVPEFVVIDNREGQINLNTMEWLLLSKIDGHRSVKQVASAVEHERFRHGQAALWARRHQPDPAEGCLGRRRPMQPRVTRPQLPVQLAPRRRPSGTPAARQPAPVRIPTGSGPIPSGSGPISTAPARPAAAGAAEPLLARLAHVREECITLLGPVGETVVQKHYLRARSEIERGAGPEAIEEAVQQIARAAGHPQGRADGRGHPEAARRLKPGARLPRSGRPYRAAAATCRLALASSDLRAPPGLSWGRPPATSIDSSVAATSVASTRPAASVLRAAAYQATTLARSHSRAASCTSSTACSTRNDRRRRCPGTRSQSQAPSA